MGQIQAKSGEKSSDKRACVVNFRTNNRESVCLHVLNAEGGTFHPGSAASVSVVTLLTLFCLTGVLDYSVNVSLHSHVSEGKD